MVTCNLLIAYRDAVANHLAVWVESNVKSVGVVVQVEVLLCNSWICDCAVRNQSVDLVAEDLEHDLLLHVLPAVVEDCDILVNHACSLLLVIYLSELCKEIEVETAV